MRGSGDYRYEVGNIRSALEVPPLGETRPVKS